MRTEILIGIEIVIEKESPAGAGDSFFDPTRTKRSHSQLNPVSKLEEYQIRLTKYKHDNMIKTR